MKFYGAAGLLALTLIAGCASSAEAPRSAPPETSAPAPAETTSPTAEPTATATMAPTVAPTPTGPPTYSQVVATYPRGTDTCDAVAELVPSGGYQVTGGSIPMRDGEFVMPCYGAKITVTETTTVEGTTYEPGTKLTVDADMNLVPVSTWE